MQFLTDHGHERRESEPAEEAEKEREPTHVEGPHGSAPTIEQANGSGFVSKVHFESLLLTALRSNGEQGRNQAARLAWSRANITIPSTTSMGKVATAGAPDSQGRCTAPLSRQTLQLCRGQVTVVPPTMPSANGPPPWGQRFSTARKPPPVLKIANCSEPS